MQNSKRTGPKNEDWLSLRGPGCFILFISLGGAYFFIMRPLIAMLNQEANVSYSTKGIAMTMLAVFFGLAYSILGRENLDRLLGSPNQKGSTLRIIIVFIMVVVVALGSILAWNSLSRALGYG